MWPVLNLNLSTPPSLSTPPLTTTKPSLAPLAVMRHREKSRHIVPQSLFPALRLQTAPHSQPRPSVVSMTTMGLSGAGRAEVAWEGERDREREREGMGMTTKMRNGEGGRGERSLRGVVEELWLS